MVACDKKKNKINLHYTRGTYNMMVFIIEIRFVCQRKPILKLQLVLVVK